MQNSIFSTLFIGQNLVKLSEVNSTNTYLKELVSKSEPLMDGTVIMADHQFAGRGQKSNVWISKKGENLTFSIYLKTSFLAVNEQFFLNKVVCLGILGALQPILGNESKIKWPNDIYFKNRKLGGILIENTTKGYQLKESIIGIGLNVNQKYFSKSLSRVTSISNVVLKDFDLENLLKLICQNIESRYLQLKSRKFELLEKDYLQNLYRLEEQHQFEINNQKVKGTIKGTNAQGKLLLQTDEGLKELDLKEVAFVFN